MWNATQWAEGTAALMARCGYNCDRCGHPLNGHLERHHRIRRRDGGDRLANLLALHPRCHTYITEHPTEATANGWIVTALGDVDIEQVPVRIAGRLWTLDDQGRMHPVP